MVFTGNLSSNVKFGIGIMIVGNGELKFEPVVDWLSADENRQLIEAVGVACDAQDRVYVFNRGEQPVVVFDSGGNRIGAWGAGQFVRPHGIWVTPNQTLLLTDDMGHSVREFSLDGKCLREIGPVGIPSQSGAVEFDFRKITQGAEPYNLPTNAVTSSTGDVFVTDGYGNSRVHHFSVCGDHVKSWGEPGDEGAQFNVPHGLGIDADDRLYVADRENSRVQIFETDGSLVATWTDVIRPCEVFVVGELVYVAELGRRTGLFPWMELDPLAPVGGLSIFDRDGNQLSRWGDADARQPKGFYAPHDIWVDSQGSIYVGEVQVSAAKLVGADTSGLPTIRKFRRV
jgi:DNA-binding beta-propeller fold protein YncE